MTDECESAMHESREHVAYISAGAELEKQDKDLFHACAVPDFRRKRRCAKECHCQLGSDLDGDLESTRLIEGLGGGQSCGGDTRSPYSHDIECLRGANDQFLRSVFILSLPE
jgi:hypothetical protein